MIGDAVEVTVVSVQASRVQIGVEAPRTLKVRRGDRVEDPDEPAAESE